MVTDSCPTCHGAGDLDLGQGAWDEVTGGDYPSRFDGSYEFVPCPTDFINGDNTKVRWKSGSSRLTTFTQLRKSNLVPT